MLIVRVPGAWHSRWSQLAAVIIAVVFGQTFMGSEHAKAQQWLVPTRFDSVGQETDRHSVETLIFETPPVWRPAHEPPKSAVGVAWDSTAQLLATGTPQRDATAGLETGTARLDYAVVDTARDLRQLSDAELVALYTKAYQQSFRAVVADRAAIVEPGRMLLQTGYTYSYDRDADLVNSVHTLPELLLRYRLIGRLELRVAWAGMVLDQLKDVSQGTSDWDTRWSDPSVGARWAFGAQKGWIPRLSVTVSSPLNVESDVNVGQRLDPFVGVGYSWRCGASWLVSGSSAAVWTRDDDRRYLDYQQSASVDYFFGQRWGVFVEWSALFPEGDRMKSLSHNLGPGFSYSLTGDLQCETAVLFGLDEPSPDVVCQLLLSWRL